MILLAEAGATSISWVLIFKGDTHSFKSAGYNPLVADANLLRQMLITSFPNEFSANDIEQIFYFGTGCGTDFGQSRVEQALKHFFQNCKSIYIDTDLMAAAMATYGSSQGVVGILGTGANAGFYNGKDLTIVAPSLGYLLGDEGSGAYLGKMLLAGILREQFSEDLSQLFYKKYNINKEDIVVELNKAKQANRFLGSFVPFLKEYESFKQMDELLEDAFQKYYTNYIKPVITKNSTDIIMVGGVAYNFKSQLQTVFIKNNIELKAVYASPLKPLIDKYRMD